MIQQTVKSIVKHGNGALPRDAVIAATFRNIAWIYFDNCHGPAKRPPVLRTRWA